jgi:DNA-binding IclR family transcriptional regulator
MMTYTDTVQKLLQAMHSDKPEDKPQLFTLNQLVRRSRIPRHKVITLLARLIRFGLARWQYTDQQILFSEPL